MSQIQTQNKTYIFTTKETRLSCRVCLKVQLLPNPFNEPLDGARVESTYLTYYFNGLYILI